MNEGLLIPLFIMIWLLQMIFIFTITLIVRNLRAANSILVQPINLLIRVAILVFIAVMWFGIVNNQLPCFLGVRFCD
jgi:hypothetical protein